MTTVSNRKIVYWMCLGVYLIGVLSYLAGLGAFNPDANTGADAVEFHGKETVVQHDYEQIEFADEEETGVLESIPLTTIQVLLSLIAMGLPILIIREIETNRHFLTAA